MSFILSNCNGSFALLGIQSRFRGVFFADENEVLSSIADIRVKGAEKYDFWSASKGKSTFWFANKLPAFFHEGSAADVLLDCRKIFDNREWGRNYQFVQDGDVLLVRYDKRDDHRETETGEYGFWIAFTGCKFEKIGEWVEEKLSFDEQRRSPPFSRHFFRALRASGSFCVAFARGRDDAALLARRSWKNRQKLAKEAEGVAKEVAGSGSLSEQYSRYSLACLQSGQGLYAGLPWFCQRWARDELVSVKGLWLSGQKTFAKAVLFYWLERLLPGGRLPGTLTSTIADVGWLFVRLEEVAKELSARERSFVLAKLDYYLQQVKLKDGLVTNNPKETWMDSLYRGGARVEINALLLASCRLARVLKKKLPLEQKLRDAARRAFLKKQPKGVYLADGSADDVVRPNVFIAAYVYPELLSRKEWLECFDFALSRLWCDWGGLSTLDKAHMDFIDQHTGEDPRSYHNGDSWFWLNNLAAIVLARFDAKRYKKYVEQIFDASVKSSSLGVQGHFPELSSAKELKAEGCLSQAWSAAMTLELIEAIDKLFKKGV
ncbi:hypothetical protein HY489_06050 [Candidatus Woesearchaeota archaeon]|nr:hypothetical protein [Candidatus Woesearchaeota archaeon]